MRAEPLQIHYVRYGEAVPHVPVPSNITLPTRTLAAACAMAGIAVDDARSRKSDRITAHKRFHVMAILRSWDRSYPAIGRLVNRDHTSCLWGVRRWAEMQEGK